MHYYHTDENIVNLSMFALNTAQDKDKATPHLFGWELYVATMQLRYQSIILTCLNCLDSHQKIMFFVLSANKRVFRAATFLVEDNNIWAFKSSPLCLGNIIFKKVFRIPLNQSTLLAHVCISYYVIS